MKSYWLYRLLFLGGVALSIAMVAITLSSRQADPVRAQGARAHPPIVARPPDQQSASVLPPASAGTEPLASRVRVIMVAPFEREIQIHNFGDAAQDLSGWQLVSPRVTGDAVYDVPLGTVILPGESVSIVVDEGVDTDGLLHWRLTGNVHVLDFAGDTVLLRDEEGNEVSRFSYSRR